MSLRLPVYLILILSPGSFGLPTCFNKNYTEIEHFPYRTPYYDDDGLLQHGDERIKTINTTITCSNLFSIDDIDYYAYKKKNVKVFLTIQHSNIASVESQSFTKFSTIVELHLSGNFIKTVKPSAFKDLTNLTALYLNDNLIEKLSRGVFNSLKYLEILDLRNNLLHNLEDYVFIGLDNLTQLFLGGNSIHSNWTKISQKIPNLTILDLSNNSISNFTFYFESLINLNLSYNNLRSFDFDLLPEVKTLDLSFNHINQLNQSKEIYISTLYLYGNHLQNLNITFKKDAIFTLDFGCNELLFIRDNYFSDFTFLKSLNLAKNFLTNFSNVFFKDLSDLRVLNLSHNQIGNIFFGTFDSLEQLEILDLSHNNLKQLHQYTFASLASLSKLYFDHNQISHFNVEDLRSHLPKLTFVSFEGNLWECKELAIIYKFFQTDGVEVKKGSYFESENVRGIACGMKNFDSNEKKAEIAEVVNDKDAFPTTNFFNHFGSEEKLNPKFTNANVSQESYVNKMIMITEFIAIVLCINILVLVFIAYFLFTKLSEPSRSTLSQIELN